MKILLLSLLALLIVTPVYGQLLSDATGFVNRLDVQTGGHSFEVQTTSNFDVYDFDFDKDKKSLTLYINSGLENNLGEILIPTNLLSGNFTFYLNGDEFSPKVKSNERITFVSLNFTGTGENKLELFGTTYLDGLEIIENNVPEPQITPDVENEGGGCLIATAAYGSELAPQVQQLRELRDAKLLQTESGKSFMKSFNEYYYIFSPIIADYERENPLFKETVKISLTPLISTLSLLHYVEMDSENEVLGYGISLIVLNLAMYVGIPASVIIGIKKKF